MVQQVDPFIYPIPKKFLNDPELRPYFEYFHRWAHDMWKRTGGSSDDVADTGLRETYPWLQEHNADDQQQTVYNVENVTNQEISYSIEAPQRQFNAVTTSDDYTAVGWDWVNAKSGSKITFPEYPGCNAELIVRVGDNSVIPIDGNDRNINGSKTGKLRGLGMSIRFKYFIDDDEWFAI